MADTEIKIDGYGIEACEKDLGKLKNQWINCPRIDKSPMNESSGCSAEYVNMCCDGAEQTRISFLNLLASSESFFRNVRVNFTESDRKAANSIQN